MTVRPRHIQTIRILSVALFAYFALAVPAVAEDAGMTCFDCHDIEPEVLENTVHGFFECTDCHVDAEPLPHDDALQPVSCSMCHDDASEQHAASVHGDDSFKHGLEAPGCATCHGPLHELVPLSDAASPVNPLNQAETCGACHASVEFQASEGIRLFRPVEAYSHSVHAQAVRSGSGGASCSSCHGTHDIVRSESPDSPVAHANVQKTCEPCHQEITEAYDKSIHGQAHAAGVKESPVCTDCHGEHQILSPSRPDSPVFATNIPLQTCGRCHGDLRLNQKFGLPDVMVPSYEDSYHGLASRAGKQSVAHCGSCHGVHDVLPSSDPESHVHESNLSETCGSCHPGAGERYALGPVHTLMDESRATVGYWVRAIYLPMIWIVIGGMLIHNLLDFRKKVAEKHGPRHDPTVKIRPRMSRGFRIAHVLTMISFIALVYTGFALKYPEAWWATPFTIEPGESDWRAIWHRIAAVVMTGALVFHMIHVVVDRGARRCILGMIPKIEDLRELRMRMAYNLGLSSTPPPAPRLGYIEKSEYLAFMWGSVIMILSGALLWFEDFTLRYFPGWTVDLATSIHLYEAILATLAIIVWHFYWVIFDPMVYPMDTTWLTGKPPLSRAEERGEIVAEGEGSAASGQGKHGAHVA